MVPDAGAAAPVAERPFQLMTKPIGPTCNLGCEYCFYLEKDALYPDTTDFRMSETTLERYVEAYLAAQPGPEVTFVWQGGEPTLLGVDFFRRVVELQRELAPAGQQVHNALQTNGTRLDDEWCRFLARHDFLVGLSLDGPAALHDAYRVAKDGSPVFDRVLAGLTRLQTHDVAYNVLCVLNDRNSRHPLEVYRFFTALGVEWLQFIPLVEPADGPTGGATPVSDRSVDPRAYGEFLCTVFDEWVRHDVGAVSVRSFDQCLLAWLPGGRPDLCVFNETCGRQPAIEHNGDVYSCDHFVEPGYRLGNVHETPLATLVDGRQQRAFGAFKRESLPADCRACSVRSVCHGGCPKDRLLEPPDGGLPRNYLCAGYRRFFGHVAPYMPYLVPVVQGRAEPEAVMARLRALDLS